MPDITSGPAGVSPSLSIVALIVILLSASTYETGYQLAVTSLTVVAAIIFGIAWGIIYIIMTDRERREHIVSVSIVTMTQLILQNVMISRLIIAITNWFSGRERELVNSAKSSNQDKILSIPFEYRGEKYILLVPHDPRAIHRSGRRMSVDSEGKKSDLKHYPGIPFTVTADLLGCADIIEEAEEF